MDLSQIGRNIKQIGAFTTFKDVAFRGLNRVVFFKVLKGVKIDMVNPDFLKCDAKYRGLFFDEALLRELGKNPENELPARFLDRALAAGEECYGFLDGDTLASYGWYSNKPAEIERPDLGRFHPPGRLFLHFDDRYIYMYKGFTHLKYRGQRLHAVGMTRALEAYLARGYRGIVSYVEWNNFSSLKSCYRMGYSDFGNIYAAGALQNYFFYSDTGCEPYGFRLERQAPSGTGEQVAAAV